MTSHHHPMCDVAVLGGGVIGLSIAYELSLRGHQVHVIDREAIDLTADENQTLFPRRTSSWAAAGILPAASLEAVTDPMDRLRGLSHQLYPRFCRRVEEESRIDTHFERSGGMYLSSTAGETASMVGMVAYWRDLEIECEEISSQDLCVRESRLSSWVERHELARAWFVPDEYQIHPPSLLRALGVACAGRGVNLVGNTVVVDIDECGTSIAVECEGEVQDLQADRVVVCGGVGIGKMSDRLALNQSVVPVRGQMLLLRQADHGLRSVINSGHRYLVPRRNGDVLIGSCEEEVGCQHGTTPKQLRALREFAFDLVPQLADAKEVGAWSGLRPMTYDGFPICGKLPSSNRIFVAGGHFRSGIHLAPATAVCLADLMDGNEPPVSLDAFRVGKQQSHSNHRSDLANA